MNKKLLFLFTGLLASAMTISPIQAQEEKPEKDDAPQAEGIEEKSAEEFKQEEEEAEKEEAATLKKMMAVFKTLEGEWVGKEKIDYNNELPGLKNKPDVEWNDEWKGFYTQNGRYFEMTGKTDGELASTYHWYVTYDTGDKEYRAWSFGSTGFSEFSGELSDDGKSVIWRKFTEGEVNNVEDTFELRAEGNKCKATGEMNVVSPDNEEVKINYYKQSSSYTRKKVEI